MTALPMIVAKELGVSWESVRVEQADTDREAFGPQWAGGSWAVRYNWDRLRLAGATARFLLIAAAAARWGAAAGECVAQEGAVVHRPSGRRLGFGELADEAARLPAPDPESVRFKEPGEYGLIGSRVPGVENSRVVTGRASFGMDVRLPNMLFAAVARSPVFGGRLLRSDDRRARRLPGVQHVVRIEGDRNPTKLRDGVAVLADSTWAALRGRDTLEPEWADGPYGRETTEGLRARLREALASPPSEILRKDGGPDRLLAAAARASDGRALEAEYEVPFLYHAQMEPMNCTVDVRAEGAEV